jgi:hypothetical protein
VTLPICRGRLRIWPVTPPNCRRRLRIERGYLGIWTVPLGVWTVPLGMWSVRLFCRKRGACRLLRAAALSDPRSGNSLRACSPFLSPPRYCSQVPIPRA